MSTLEKTDTDEKNTDNDMETVPRPSDPIPVIDAGEPDVVHEDDATGTKLVPPNTRASSSDSSSSPTSPSSKNPLTPERQDSPDHDHTVIITTIDQHDGLHDHFPNPYDDPPPVAFTHARVHSAPYTQTLLHPGYQQPPQRLPSILRPSHPKTFNTSGTRRASLALTGIDFDSTSLASMGLGGDPRLSVHSTPSFSMEEEDPLTAYAVTPWQPPPHSSYRATASSPPSSLHQNQRDEEPHIEVSERFVDEQPSEARAPETQPLEQTLEKKSADLWPGRVPALKGGVKKAPRWKFWARRPSQIPKKV